MDLTVEQFAKVLFKSRAQSRRKDKRYLKEQGGSGRGPELDQVLESIAAHPDRARIEGVAAQLAAAQQRAEQAEAEAAARREVERKEAVVAKGRAGDWPTVLLLLGDRLEARVDEEAWAEREREAVLRWGLFTNKAVAARLAVQGDGWIDWGDDDPYEAVCVAVSWARRDEMEASALERCRAVAVKGGRWAVLQNERGSGNLVEMVEFENRGDAQDYLALLGDLNRTAYTAVILNGQEADYEAE